MFSIFFDKKSPDYMSEVYFPADQNGINTLSSYNKLNLPVRKTNAGLKALSFIGPTSWNKIPQTIKCSKTLNSFKHNLRLIFKRTEEKRILFLD